MIIVILPAIVASSPSIVKADIQVYDKNNQYLGILINLESDQIDLFIPSLSSIFMYETGDFGFCGDELQAFFESNDCSGIAYSEDPYPVIVDFSPISIEGFYKVENIGKKTFRPGSHIIGPSANVSRQVFILQQSTTRWLKFNYLLQHQ